MGDRRTNERRVGDRRTTERRVTDRRETEKGIVKVTIKNLIWYGIIVVIVTAFIVTFIYYVRDKIEEEKNSEYDSYRSYEYIGKDNEDNIYDSNYTCDVILNSDKNQIKPGESVIYEITAINIEAEDGIIMFETSLIYNTDMFTCKILNDENDVWNKTSMIDNYLTMTRNDLTPNSEDQTIVKIEFTAKENVQAQEETINFSGIKFTMDNDESFNVDDQSVGLEIVND